MKWPFMEAHVVIVSKKNPFTILHLIRFKQVPQNGYEKFQTEPLTTSRVSPHHPIFVSMVIANFFMDDPKLSIPNYRCLTPILLPELSFKRAMYEEQVRPNDEASS